MPGFRQGSLQEQQEACQLQCWTLPMSNLLQKPEIFMTAASFVRLPVPGAGLEWCSNALSKSAGE
jgi:hypothetical protein